MGDRVPPLSVNDFAIGDRVRYVPVHAHGDIHHPDCQDGRVEDKNNAYLYVRFPIGLQVCYADQLVKR